MIRVQFLSEAEKEMNISAQFYNDRENQLGSDFLNDLDAGIEQIKMNPKIWVLFFRNKGAHNSETLIV